MYQDDNSKFQQDFVNLLTGLDPSEYCSKTERSILITNLKEARLTQIKPKKQSSADFSKMPELLEIEQKSATGLINTKKYLFTPVTNELPNQSAVNMLYLFKVCKKIQIIFVLKHAQILNPDNKEVLNILQYFTQKFQNCQSVQAVIDQFSDCVGFAVEDAPDLKQSQKYLDQLRKIKNIEKQGKAILQKIIKNQRVILTNANRPINEFIVEVNEKVKQFVAHPKNTMIILQYLLNVNQVKWLNEKIEVNYIKKVENIMSKINDGVQDCSIFSENESDRSEIIQNIKSELRQYKTLPRKNKNEIKRVDHFIIQHGYYMLNQFGNIQDQFYRLENNPNQENNFYDWNSQSIINRSVAADVLYHIFSEMTIFYDSTMCGVANYLHSFFKVFEFVPDNQLRSTQTDSVYNLLQIIEKLIKTIHTSLDDLIKDLKNLKQQWKVASRKLLGLAYTIENLIKKFNQFLNKGRDPFDRLTQDIQESKVYIYELFFFCSWSCFKRYEKFWNNEKKNKFFCDLYEIAFLCKKTKYRSMLEGSRLSQCSNIITKMNEYFGLIYQKNKIYDKALKFFVVAKMNWKVINCCNLWLKSILEGNKTEANFKNISQCLNILVGLGIIEEARKWCYQFMQNVEENSQFIVLLQDFVEKQNNQKAMKNYLKFLTTDENILVQQEIFKEISKQLKKQEWLLQN